MRRLVPILVLLLLIGCQREPVPVPVSGTVTVDGTPLAEGKISFIILGQVPVQIDIKDGQFSGKVKPGEQRVEIAAYRPYRIPADVPKSMHALMADGKENYLHPNYHSNSILKANVQADGKNEFTFQLTKTGK